MFNKLLVSFLADIFILISVFGLAFYLLSEEPEEPSLIEVRDEAKQVVCYRMSNTNNSTCYPYSMENKK